MPKHEETSRPRTRKRAGRSYLERIVQMLTAGTMSGPAQTLTRLRADDLAAELETILDSIPEALYIADHLGIVKVNKSGARLLGFDNPADVPTDVSEILRIRNAHAIHTNEPIPYDQSGLRQALQGKRVQYECFIDDPNHPGKKLMLRVASAPIRNRSGTVIGAVSINSDLTELTKLEAQIHSTAIKQRLLRQKARLLKQQNAELLKLNRSKDEFIALASHQLRTPATGVKQYVGMLIDGYAGELTADQKRLLDRAYESNERQLSTINDLLQIARIDADKLELHKTRVNLRELVEAVSHEQQGTLKRRGQTIELEPGPAGPYVLADQLRLRMAIDNLVDNASKYSLADTTVEIRLESAGSQARLVITDRGVGIARADFDKLFQKFSRIDNPLSIAVGGNGLGLYFVKKVIDAHCGQVLVDSAVNKGTTFTIVLPLANTGRTKPDSKI
jgi:PAS domain S-box-containing protein